MSSYTFDIFPRVSKFDTVKKEIETLLANNKNYVVNFYFEEPNATILNVDENIVIKAEYNTIAKILIDFAKSHSNFKFDKREIDELIIAKWAVISQENSEQNADRLSSK